MVEGWGLYCFSVEISKLLIRFDDQARAYQKKCYEVNKQNSKVGSPGCRG